MEFEFPIPLFLTLRKELSTVRNDIEKEKAVLKAVRDTLGETDMKQLDEAFFTTFDSLTLSSTDLPDAEQTLTKLVKKGASARLMTNHELDAYNVAMLMQYITMYNNSERLKLFASIVRTAVIAGADIHLQKAYVLNGGMNALNFLCSHLAAGTAGLLYNLTPEQCQCCYDIFPLLAIQIDDAVASNPGYDFPYQMFMASLKDAPDVAALQEQTILRIMALGWTPFSVTTEYLTGGFFSDIVTINPKWLTLLFPYEHEQLKGYIDTVKRQANAPVIKNMINGLTSTNKGRKHFRAFFAQKPHWFIKLIVTDMPEIVFNLVQRNERDMLIPFLRHFKREIALIRDENNRTLLAYASTSKRVVENTVQLLRQANLS